MLMDVGFVIERCRHGENGEKLKCNKGGEGEGRVRKG
jgi:hypothetical protein